MFRLAAVPIAALLIPALVAAAPAPQATSTSAATTAVSSASTASSASGGASGTSSAPPVSATVPFASDDPNTALWEPLGGEPNPQPIRGQLGAEQIIPTNQLMDQESPDLLGPPSTDAGSVQNAKWPFSLSHNRMQTGGWARQQNLDVMPIADQMAGVNMRLKVGAVRELHWHSTAEWAYVIAGSVQITAVNQDGQNYVATVNTGDLWYFPAGVPHSLQATDSDDHQGAEFLLVFDNGSFSEDNTFLLTDWLAHIPKDVIAKNFQMPQSAFDHIPKDELYIFPAAAPDPSSSGPSSPQGTMPNPLSFAMSQMKATQLPGGTVKVVDSTTFKASKTIAAALVTVEPGAMRELHWHPTQDEWSYFISGEARMTLFAASGNARTFDYLAGDVGYVPASFGHYVENLGNTTLTFLEIFKTDKFQDISLNQWLALTPPDLVKAHLDLSDDTIAHLSKTKQTVVGGSNSTNSTSA